MLRFHASRLTRLGAVSTISALLAAACGAAPPPPAAGPPPAVPVEFLMLETRPIERVDEFVGTIRSLSSTTVQAQAEGFLTRVLVTSGMRVDPGAPMFEIDATTERAGLVILEAQRKSREADAALARQQAERANRLLEVGAISQQEHEQALARRQTTTAELQAIDDQIRQQQAQLSYFRVTAQTAGIVGDVPARVGDRVTRATVLTTIEGNTNLEAYINVPLQRAPQLRPGLPVQILDDAGGTLLSTRVSFVSPSVDDATQSVLAKAPVAARGDRLRADQFVRARIVWGTAEGLVVPVMAVQRIGNQHFVFVAEAAGGEGGGLVARQRPVVLGPITGDAYPVLSGVNAGDRLVLAGTQKIGDGSPVQALPAGPPGGAREGAPAGPRGGA